LADLELVLQLLDEADVFFGLAGDVLQRVLLLRRRVDHGPDRAAGALAELVIDLVPVERRRPPTAGGGNGTVCRQRAIPPGQPSLAQGILADRGGKGEGGAECRIRAGDRAAEGQSRAARRRGELTARPGPIVA